MIAFLSITLNILAPIFLVIGLSAIFGTVFKPDPRPISGLIIYVFVPSLVLRTLANADVVLGEVLGMGAAIFLMTVLLVVVGRLTLRVLHLPESLHSAFLVSIVMVNAANYGIPLNTFAFGEQGMEMATIYYILTVIIGNNAGIFIASHGQAGLKQAVLNVVRVPVFPATILGILLNVFSWPIPEAVDRALDILGSGTVPAMLAVLGIQLATVRVNRSVLRSIFSAASLRLMIAPLIVTPIAWGLGLRGIPLYVTVVQSSTPTAVLAASIATEFGSDSEFVSAVTLVSTLLSVVTIGILLALMGVS